MNKIKTFLTPLYYFFWENYILIMNLFFKSKIENYKDIPIIINNRNRLTFMLDMIKALEARGYSNIYIIDNKSSYPPLLEYYDTCPYKVFKLKENIGFLSLWKTDIYKNFIKDFYVYTDADVVPTENCPDDFLNVFLQKMKKSKKIMKIGLSLKIDDLPDYFDKKDDVIAWEKKYFTKETDDGFYNANVDTTFALYRPFMKGGASRLKMLRSKSPYEAYHMPWYNDSNNLNDEEKYYVNNSRTSTHWTKK